MQKHQQLPLESVFLKGFFFFILPNYARIIEQILKIKIDSAPKFLKSLMNLSLTPPNLEKTG